MGVNILVIGEPGTGKSRGIKNLDPKKTVVIKPNNKDLPFKGGSKKYSAENKNELITNDFNVIGAAIKTINEQQPHITTVIIEDTTHAFSKRVMDESSETGYQKWTDLAVDFFTNIIEYEVHLRKDLNLILIGHTETVTDVDGKSKVVLQTPGKLLDKAIKIPSYFTYILHSSVKEGDKGKMEYKFLTNYDGVHLAKSPEDCLPKYVDNDYAAIIEAIQKYQNS